VHVTPLIIREPESAWWRTHDDDDDWQEPVEPEPPVHDEAMVTVAIVGDAETGWNTDAVVLRLAELAVNDELVVVYGRARSQHHAVVAGLRGRLPRHDIVDVHIRSQAEVRQNAGATLMRLLEDGSLPVVVTTMAAIDEVTAEIAGSLEADRVMRVFRTTAGADLYQVWHRRPALDVG
jgi:hypothetical protein